MNFVAEFLIARLTPPSMQERKQNNNSQETKNNMSCAPNEENKDEGAGGIKVKTMGGGGYFVTLDSTTRIDTLRYSIRGTII
jgi:hypothetical protein